MNTIKTDTSAPPSGTKPRQTLFLWDFDNTVVLDNTDLIIFERLSPSLLEELRHAPRNPTFGWTQLVDTGLGKLSAAGITSHQILEASAAAHFPRATADAIRSIARDPHAQSAILSDANTLFIDACLRKNDLDAASCFQAGIFTNPAVVDDLDRIRVSPFIPLDDTARQHGCHSCARNMCKGALLEQLTAGRFVDWRIVYIGDGSNDFCPSKRIGPDGFVFPREGYSLAKKLAASPPEATVKPWGNAQQLQKFIAEVL